MPLYEYQCDVCKHRFERIQKFSDPLLTICPQCGGEIRKLLSSPAIQFKGTGWYVTDYAKKGRADTEIPEASKSSDGENTKSDTTDSKAGDSASSPDSSKKTSESSPNSSNSTS